MSTFEVGQRVRVGGERKVRTCLSRKSKHCLETFLTTPEHRICPHCARLIDGMQNDCDLEHQNEPRDMDLIRFWNPSATALGL